MCNFTSIWFIHYFKKATDFTYGILTLGTHTVTLQRACILFIFACGQHTQYSYKCSLCDWVNEFMNIWPKLVIFYYIRFLNFPIWRCKSHCYLKELCGFHVLISVNKEKDENKILPLPHVSELFSSCGYFTHTHLTEFTKLTTRLMTITSSFRASEFWNSSFELVRGSQLSR